MTVTTNSTFQTCSVIHFMLNHPGTSMKKCFHHHLAGLYDNQSSP